MEGFGLADIMQHLPKIKEWVEKGKTYLPKVVEYEKNMLTEDEKKQNAKVVYTIMAAENKVFLYIWVMVDNNGTSQVHRQIQKVDILALAESPEMFILKMMGE